MYALVVLLNLNIVMASYGKGSNFGYVSIYRGLKGEVEDSYRFSLYLSLAYAVVNLAGYVVITSFLAMTEVPITIKQTDKAVAEALQDVNIKEVDYRDHGAFLWWFLTLVSGVPDSGKCALGSALS